MPNTEKAAAFIQVMYRNRSGTWTPTMVPLTKFVALNEVDLAASIDGLTATDVAPLTSYAAAATVTQASSKSTGVTLNRGSGQITMNNAALNTLTVASFVLTSSAIGAGDLLVLNHISGGTIGVYGLNARCAAGSATIDVFNKTAGSLSEAIVIGFSVVKASIA